MVTDQCDPGIIDQKERRLELETYSATMFTELSSAIDLQHVACLKEHNSFIHITSFPAATAFLYHSCC